MSQDITTDGRYEPTIGIDAIHTILKSGRRRHVLRILQRSSPLQTGDLIDAAARQEYGAEYTNAERKRVRVSLHQAHLPKLIEHRVAVERSDHYELGPTANVVIDVLDCSEQAAGVHAGGGEPEAEREQYNSVTGWMEKIGLN